MKRGSFLFWLHLSIILVCYQKRLRCGCLRYRACIKHVFLCGGWFYFLRGEGALSLDARSPVDKGFWGNTRYFIIFFLKFTLEGAKNGVYFCTADKVSVR